MSGYRPYMWGAKEAAQRAYAAQARREREAKRAEYLAYAHESAACGNEVESFEEWMGEVDPRQLAEERMDMRCGGRASSMSLDDRCYYGDIY